MNTPNKLTIIRILLVPAMLIVYLINIPGTIFNIPVYAIILDLIFIVGAITDKIDGYLARKNNQITNFGKFLDPIADKILVISAMLILIQMGNLPAWIPIIITREVVVSGYRLIAVQEKGNVIAASKWGKIKTVTQMIAIILAFLDTNSFGTIFVQTLPIWQFLINFLTTVFMIACVIATIFSGYDYLKDGKDLLRSK